VAAVVAVAVRLVAIVWDLWWRDGGGSVMHVKVYWMFRVSDSGVLRGNIMYARSYLCSDTQLPVSNVGLVHVHFQGKILSMWCVRLHCHTLNAKTDVKNMYPQSITCFDALFHLSRAIRESPSFTKQSSWSIFTEHNSSPAGDEHPSQLTFLRTRLHASSRGWRGGIPIWRPPNVMYPTCSCVTDKCAIASGFGCKTSRHSLVSVERNVAVCCILGQRG
jgi:hypothetical protein